MTDTPYIRPTVTRKDISLAEMRKLVDADPQAGVLRWRERSSVGDKQAKQFNRKYAGHEWGTIKDHGVYASVRGDTLSCADVMWFVTRGAWPKTPLVHLDGSQYNNRLANLRESGIDGPPHRGLRLLPTGCWRAEAAFGRDTVVLGEYSTAREAEERLQQVRGMVGALLDLV